VKERHEAALVEELALVLDGSRVPDADSELTDLVAISTALETIPAPRPREEFRAGLRATLLTEAAEHVAAVQRPGLVDRLRHGLEQLRRAAALATAAATGAFLLSGLGLVAAAEHAQPGDTLYGLKQVTENVRIALAADDLDAGRLALQLAERRLDEVASGARTLSPGTLVDTLARMDARTREGADLLLDVHVDRGDPAALRELSSFVERQSRRLADVISELPVSVVPFALESLDLLHHVEQEAAMVLVSGCVACEDGVGPLGDTRCCPPSDESTSAGEGGASAGETSGTTTTDGSTEADTGTPSTTRRLRGIIPVDSEAGATDDGGSLLDDTAKTVDDVVEEITGTVGEIDLPDADDEDDPLDLLGD
jgi:hypothetical protein